MLGRHICLSRSCDFVIYKLFLIANDKFHSLSTVDWGNGSLRSMAVLIGRAK